MAEKKIVPINSLSDCLDLITRSEEFIREHIAEQTSEWHESDRGTAVNEVQEVLESLIADFDTALTLPEPSSSEDSDE